MFLSCEKDASNPGGPSIGGLLGNTITGKIDNWTGGGNKTIKCAYGSSKINQDGSFSIQLAPPPDSLLKPVTNILQGYSQCSPYPNISDQSAKIGCKIEAFCVVITDSQWITVGSLYRVSPKDSNNNEFYNLLAYSNKNVNISGDFNCTSGSYPYYFIKNFKWNVQFTNGWNSYYVKEWSDNQGPYNPSYSYNVATSTEPAGCKWVFSGL